MKTEIHETAIISPDADIKVKGLFKLGAYSKLESCKIRGNNVIIGDHFYSTDGLNIGGGGCDNETANLTIGDRCTFHNNFINVCMPVEIGNDVGLSHHVSIITHGFWQSVLEGYPRRFEGVKIGNGVIFGYRSLVNAGVEIVDNCVIGSQANVTKSLIHERAVYGGNPAKFIKNILRDPRPEKTLNDIIIGYTNTCNRVLIDQIITIYPNVTINKFTFNVENFKYSGIEDKFTDDFRDYLRRYGIRIYTKRPFKSL